MEFQDFVLTGAELEEYSLGETMSVERLEGETDSNNTNNTNNNNNGGFSWTFTVVIVLLFVALIAWFFFSGRKNRSGEKEYTESIEAIRPGNKVTSRGGLCGVVVEVCDDNTVIIESGSEASGKSRFKLMKECIYETDAKGPTQIAREEAELRRKQEKEAKLAAKEAAKKGETPAENVGEPAQQAAEPAPETAPETAPEEKSADNME